MFPFYKLIDPDQALVNCDSTLILLQPVFMATSDVHNINKSKNFSGQRISVLMYFSDSLKADTVYRNFSKKVIGQLQLPNYSNDFTIDGEIAGNATYIPIDKKRNSKEYERRVEISLRYYSEFYELKLDFERITYKPVKCK